MTVRFSSRGLRWAASVLALSCACAPAAARAQQQPPQSGKSGEAVIVRQHQTTWPIKTRENVDLWLHGFALLSTDSTTKVPLFRRGYRDEMVVYKNQANVLTQLDANIDRLRDGLKNNPRLADAQFAALYFSSVDDMHAAIDVFIASNGNPRAGKTPGQQMALSVLANYFGTTADRAWLSLFASSLWDEQTRYYHSWWMQQQRVRGPVIDTIQNVWQNLARPRIQRFLNNTQQANGDLLLSPALGGEGRTLTTGGSKNQIVAIPFPERAADAAEPVYVVAHEVTGGIVDHIVTDNISPAQERAGVGAKLRATGTVRAGLLLLEQLVPELADGYARYYLRAAGLTPGASPRAQLAAEFPVSDAMLKEIGQQIETVQGGI